MSSVGFRQGAMINSSLKKRKLSLGGSEGGPGRAGCPDCRSLTASFPGTSLCLPIPPQTDWDGEKVGHMK